MDNFTPPNEATVDLQEPSRSTEPEPQPVPDRKADPHQWTRWGTIAVALGVTVIAISTITVWVAGYPAIGDWGVMLVRSHDVGTINTPLLGTRSSVTGDAAARIMHHPGPVEFYFSAPFVRIFGERGLAIAGAANHILWFTVLAALTGRVFGRRARFAVATAGLTLIASMGVDEAVSAWPPTAIVFPLAVTMVAAAALIVGDRRGWLPLVLGFTFVAQSNLAAAPIAAVIVLSGMAASALYRVRNGPPSAAAQRRAAPIALGVGFVAWLPPLIEQLSDKNPNMTAILQGAGGDGNTFGLQRAAESVSAMVSSPFGWAGERYRRPWLPDASLGFGQSVPPPPYLLVALGIGLCISAAIAAYRVVPRGELHRFAVRVQLWCFAWIGAAVLIAARAPFRDQVISLGWIRWLWPLGMLASAVMLWNLVAALAGRRHKLIESRPNTRRSKVRAWSPSALIVGLACLPLVTTIEPSRMIFSRMSATSESLTSIEAGIGAVLDRDQPEELVLAVDPAGSSIAGVLIHWLEQRGIDVRPQVVGDAGPTGNQAIFGDERRQPPLGYGELTTVPSLYVLWLNGTVTLPGTDLRNVVACGPIDLDECRGLIALNRLASRSDSQDTKRQEYLDIALQHQGLQIVAVYEPATTE